MIGKVLGGRYEINEKIGDGGMAVVYKAHCCLLKRDVAVKILRSEYSMDEEFVEQFKKESLAAASLSHHNIVNIFDVGEESGLYYIVMEYVKGQTLKSFINNEKIVSVDRAVRIAAQICSALEHAHKKNVIHRDIKPQNIVMTDDDIVKVADFGIAKIATSSTITAYNSSIMGSVHYFSPEQARGGYTDQQTDIYSLGIVLYEMVTGKLPFNGDTPVSVALEHINKDPEPPSEVNPDIPQALGSIILKAIEKDKNIRYKYAEQINKDLIRFLKEPDNNFIINSSFNATAHYKPIKSKEGRSLPEKTKGNSGKSAYRIILVSLVIISSLSLLMITGAYIARRIYNEYFYVQEVKVPNLIGLTEQEAREKLEADGLVLVIIRRMHNKDFKKDVIISQKPQENTLVKAGREIEVELSLGPSLVRVPKVVNMTEREARLELEKYGLSIGEVFLDFNEYPENYVYEQNPKEGISVEEGTGVDIYVSRGAKSNKVLVPNLVGQPVDIAETLLLNAGLKLGETKNINTKRYPKGVVVKQSTDSNRYVDKDIIVDIYVSTGEYPKQTIEVYLPSEPENFHVKIVMIKGHDVRTIYSNENSPQDSPLEIIIEGEGVYRIEVYINDNDIPYATKEVDFGE